MSKYFEEIDDLSAPLSSGKTRSFALSRNSERASSFRQALGIERRCSTANCRQSPRPRRRTCERCTTRRWRERHCDAITERERARTWDEMQLLHRNARAYVATYIRRGKLYKQPCRDCGHHDGRPYHPDPSKPLDVIWLCVYHREEARLAHDEQREAVAVEALEAARLATWRERLERCEREFPLLPPDTQAELRRKAAKCPFGLPRPLSESSPLYCQQLVRAFEYHSNLRAM